MDFIDDAIEAYAEQFTTAPSPLLNELAEETIASVHVPQMLSGHLQGRFLSMLSHLTRPKRILEIGTYTGYSAICLAEGLQANGELHTIDLDINGVLQPMIRRYFNRSELGNKIHLHIGEALQVIPTIEGPFDLVFIDADKPNYGKYFDLVIENMPSGALIIADNVLWSGKVLDTKANTDPQTLGLAAYAKKLREDDRVVNLLLPVRDGLMVSRKK